MKTQLIIKKCEVCKKEFKSYKKENQKLCSLLCRDLFFTYKQYLKTFKLLKNFSKNFILWFTGFWEGEGCLCSYIKKNKYITFKFMVSQNDLLFLKRLKNKFKLGNIYERHGFGNCYNWEISGTGRILAIIKHIFPYIQLKHRKQQISKFLQSKFVKELIKLSNKIK